MTGIFQSIPLNGFVILLYKDPAEQDFRKK